MSDELKGVYGALAEAAGEMKAIAKDQRNTQQNFDFRSIESIVGHAKPLLAKHSLAIVPGGFDVLSSERVESSRGTAGWRTVVRGQWTIGHADGSTIQASMVGEAVDYGDKSASKAVQMAYKYMLTQLLGIGSEDPDGLSPEVAAPSDPVEKEPAEELTPEQIAEKGTNKLKAEALDLLGDADEAKALWRQALAVYDMEPGDVVPTELHEKVHATLEEMAP